MVVDTIIWNSFCAGYGAARTRSLLHPSGSDLDTPVSLMLKELTGAAQTNAFVRNRDVGEGASGRYSNASALKSTDLISGAGQAHVGDQRAAHRMMSMRLTTSKATRWTRCRAVIAESKIRPAR